MIKKPQEETNSIKKDKTQTSITTNLQTFLDEYDDPSTELSSEFYSDSYETEEETEEIFTDLDIRNMNSLEKIAKYAEKIFIIAEDNDVALFTSSEKFHKMQTEISEADKESSVRWLINMQFIYSLYGDTLLNSVAYFHIALCNHSFPLSHLRLLAAVCLWISEKVEEHSQPGMEGLIKSTGNIFSKEDIIHFESELLEILQFQLSFSTPKFFMRRYLDIFDSIDDNLMEASYFFCDVALIYTEFLDFSSPTIAFSAVCLGLAGLDQYCPTEKLLSYAHIENVSAIQPCMKSLIERSIPILNNPNDSLYHKYTVSQLKKAILKLKLSLDMLHKITI